MIVFLPPLDPAEESLHNLGIIEQCKHTVVHLRCSRHSDDPRSLGDIVPEVLECLYIAPSLSVDASEIDKLILVADKCLLSFSLRLFVGKLDVVAVDMVNVGHSENSLISSLNST